MKTVNLTIRIDQDLKEKASLAAARFDLTLSQVVRRSLKSLVLDHQKVSGVEIDHFVVEKKEIQKLEDLSKKNGGLSKSNSERLRYLRTLIRK